MKAEAEQAETESAATEAQDVAQAEGSAETEDSAKPAAGHEEAGHEAAGHEPGDGEKPDLDDVKRKFREALDRKKQFHTEGQGKGGHESGKVNGAHGPAASRRNFRRKSG